MKYCFFILWILYFCLFVFIIRAWWTNFKTSTTYINRIFKYSIKIKVIASLPSHNSGGLQLIEDDTLLNIKKELDSKGTMYYVEKQREFSSYNYPEIFYVYTLRFNKAKDRLAFQIKHCTDGSIINE
jgi:hypothetical protein